MTTPATRATGYFFDALPRTCDEFVRNSDEAPKTTMKVMTEEGECLELAHELRDQVRILLWLPPFDALSALADASRLYVSPLYLSIDEPERAHVYAWLEDAVDARNAQPLLEIRYFVSDARAWLAYRATLQRIVHTLIERRRWPPGVPCPEGSFHATR